MKDVPDGVYKVTQKEWIIISKKDGRWYGLVCYSWVPVTPDAGPALERSGINGMLTEITRLEFLLKFKRGLERIKYRERECVEIEIRNPR